MHGSVNRDQRIRHHTTGILRTKLGCMDLTIRRTMSLLQQLVGSLTFGWKPHPENTNFSRPLTDCPEEASCLLPFPHPGFSDIPPCNPLPKPKDTLEARMDTTQQTNICLDIHLLTYWFPLIRLRNFEQMEHLFMYKVHDRYSYQELTI